MGFSATGLEEHCAARVEPEDGNDVQRRPHVVQRRRFSDYALKKGINPDDYRGTADSKGQMYEVVFRPKVAIRIAPACDAEVIRTAYLGSKIRLFEWDSTRMWRRCSVNRSVDPDEDEIDTAAEGGRRRSAIKICDGWIMVEHPFHGVLLQAVPALVIDLNDAETSSGEACLSSPDSTEAAAEEDLERRRRMEVFAEVLSSVDELPGEPRLKRAVRAGNYEVVRQILNDVDGMYCSPLNEDKQGASALHEAAAACRLDFVGLLLLCRANPGHRNKEHLTPGDVAGDDLTRTVLAKWEGLRVDMKLLRLAVSQVHEKDKVRIANKLGVVAEDSVEACVAVHHQEPVTQDRDGHIEPPEVQPLQETTKYVVVYKMVAVRKFPKLNAPTIRAKRRGDVVDLHEWDDARRFRRTRVEVACEDADIGGDASMVEVDGWMLIHSDQCGLLLRELDSQL